MYLEDRKIVKEKVVYKSKQTGGEIKVIFKGNNTPGSAVKRNWKGGRKVGPEKEFRSAPLTKTSRKGKQPQDLPGGEKPEKRFVKAEVFTLRVRLGRQFLFRTGGNKSLQEVAASTIGEFKILYSGRKCYYPPSPLKRLENLG